MDTLAERGETPAARPAIARGDAEGRRRALIEAGERIMAEEGLSALTARRLASEAGVSLGAAYHLFRDLEGLIVEVNGRTFGRLKVALGAVSLTGEDVEADLLALADAYIDFVLSHPKLWASIFELPLKDGEPGPNAGRVDELLGALDAAFVPTLPDDPETAKASARVLWAAVHGLVSLSVTNRMGTVGIPDLRAATRHLIRCHLAGLRAGHA